MRTVDNGFDFEGAAMPEQPLTHKGKPNEYRKHAICYAMTITLGVAIGLTGFFVCGQPSKQDIASGQRLGKAFLPSVQARQSLRPLSAGITPSKPDVYHAAAQRSFVVMMGRKGRPQMPQGMTGQMQQSQYRQPDMPQDGTPIFYLYCRSEPGNPWYPVSAMKGDGQSKSLVTAWLNAPFGKTVLRDRLDEGMARSIFESERRLADMAVTQYRQLKNNKNRLQWGFKTLSTDILAKEAKGEIEKGQIVPVNRGMINKEGLVQQAQKAAQNMFSGNKETE
jgi:hypothetical protein